MVMSLPLWSRLQDFNEGWIEMGVILIQTTESQWLSLTVYHKYKNFASLVHESNLSLQMFFPCSSNSALVTHILLKKSSVFDSSTPPFHAYVMGLSRESQCVSFLYLGFCFFFPRRLHSWMQANNYFQNKLQNCFWNTVVWIDRKSPTLIVIYEILMSK